MAATDFARTTYIANALSHKYLGRVELYDGVVEVPYDTPIAANPANCAPVPASTQDIQSFIMGPMTHSLTLRPQKRDTSGCCADRTFRFHLAANAFGPTIGDGEMSNGCCGDNQVTVRLPNNHVLRGQITRPCCTCQPRVNLDWETGENMSWRGTPCFPCCCGPWRSGYVGTAPGEEADHNIRYWDVDGSYWSCSCFLCCLPCKSCCWHCRQSCCDCPDEVGYTSWQPLTIPVMKNFIQSRYSFSLQSMFGEPVFGKADPNSAEGTTGQPSKSDINALGDYRIREVRRCCCCCTPTLMDVSDSADIAKQSAFDITFRGTFNQNALDQKDFNLILGYLILNAQFFLERLGSGKYAQSPSVAALQTLPRALALQARADVRPNMVPGNKMV